jgi:integrase/recombinase XerD
MVFFRTSYLDLQEKKMLTTYCPDPNRLELIQRTPVAPYLDGFIAEMVEAGYRLETVRCYVRAAAHMSHWLTRRRKALTDLSLSQIREFRRHLPRCDCAGHEKDNRSHAGGAALFLRYLQKINVVAIPAPKEMPPLFVGFCQWLQEHRGAKGETLRAYGRTILDALQALGEDPQRYSPSSLRAFVLDRAPRYGRSKAKLVVTTLRTFVRYLIAQGLCPIGLDGAIPTIAGWRLASLPRYLPAADVERILATCDCSTACGTRERAILLLLARMGLRVGDVCDMRLSDIDWEQATLKVSGKSHRDVRLPLSQEVGDALLHYLTTARPKTSCDRVFLRKQPPLTGALNPCSIARIVKRNIQRAGVSAPSHGTHLLRNSAATSLLGQGASLQSIAVLLRHNSLDTTTRYAKVDIKLLRQLARPWPEVSPC